MWPFHCIRSLLNASWHRKSCTVNEVCVAGSIMKHRHPGPYLIGPGHRPEFASLVFWRSEQVMPDTPLLVRSVHHDMPTLLYLVILLNCYNWETGLYLVFLKHELICHERWSTWGVGEMTRDLQTLLSKDDGRGGNPGTCQWAWFLAKACSLVSERCDTLLSLWALVHIHMHTHSHEHTQTHIHTSKLSYLLKSKVFCCSTNPETASGTSLWSPGAVRAFQTWTSFWVPSMSAEFTLSRFIPGRCWQNTEGSD